MVDLGKWLGEEYRIPTPLTGEDLLAWEDLSEEEWRDLQAPGDPPDEP